MQDPQRSWDLWRRRNEKPQQPSPKPSPIALDYVVPAVMALAGVVLLLVGFRVAGAEASQQAALYSLLAFGGVFSISGTILGLALVSRFFDVDYGPTGSFLLKSCGLLLLVDSLWLVGWRVWGYPLLLWIVLWPVASLLAVWLFRQRGKDAALTIVALFVIRVLLVVTFFVATILVSFQAD